MGNGQLSQWVRVDVLWLSHAKARRAGLEGRALWIAGLLWSARMDTDGAISADVLELLAVEAGIVVTSAQDAADRLVTAGTWERTADGWQIHDYEDCQETTAERQLRRSNGAERQRLRRERVTRQSRVSHALVVGPEAEAEAEAEADNSSSSSPPQSTAPSFSKSELEEEEKNLSVSQIAQRIANTRATTAATNGKARNPAAYALTLTRRAAEWEPHIRQMLHQGRTPEQIHDALTKPTPTTTRRLTASELIEGQP